MTIFFFIYFLIGYVVCLWIIGNACFNAEPVDECPLGLYFLIATLMFIFWPAVFFAGGLESRGEL